MFLNYLDKVRFDVVMNLYQNVIENKYTTEHYRTQ